MKVWRLIAHDHEVEKAIQLYKEKGFVSLGWGFLGDLREGGFQSAQDIQARIKALWPETNNEVSGGRSLWGFWKEISKGDRIIVLGKRGQGCVFEVTGEYDWESQSEPGLEEYQHQRKVKLLSVDPAALKNECGGKILPPWNQRWALGLYGEKGGLSRSEISAIVARYHVEYPKFERLATLVQQQAFHRLREKGIRNMVTFRTKSPDSLHKKLSKEREKRLFLDVKDSLSPSLKDLAAIRVLLYLPEDRESTVATLREIFRVQEEKTHANPEGYQASHLYVCVDPALVEEGSQELSSLWCDIQVCTLTEHIWNELEHDIRYKQGDGTPDTGQQELLTSLHHMLDISSKAVDRLMKRTKARIQENSEPILEPEGLQVYLSGRFKRTIRGDFGSLLEFLKGLVKVVTKAELDRLFESGLSEAKAREDSALYDANGSERELAWIALMLLPSLDYPNVLDATSEGELKPLLKMLRKVALNKTGGKA